MQDLIIGLLQFDQAWQNPQENRNRIEYALKKQSSADLVVIPEMAFTGFSMNAEEHAEDWEKSESISWLKEQSLRHNTAFYTSLLIKSNGKFYNRGVFVSEGNVLAHYDKQHLFAFAGEDAVFESGNNQTIVSFKGWKINPSKRRSMFFRNDQIAFIPPPTYNGERYSGKKYVAASGTISKAVMDSIEAV